MSLPTSLLFPWLYLKEGLSHPFATSDPCLDTESSSKYLSYFRSFLGISFLPGTIPSCPHSEWVHLVPKVHWRHHRSTCPSLVYFQIQPPWILILDTLLSGHHAYSGAYWKMEWLGTNTLNVPLFLCFFHYASTANLSAFTATHKLATILELSPDMQLAFSGFPFWGFAALCCQLWSLCLFLLKIPLCAINQCGSLGLPMFEIYVFCFLLFVFKGELFG